MPKGSWPRVAAFAGVLWSWQALAATWPAGLPVYDHIVIVIEENKDYEQIIPSKDAPFINQMAADGALFTKMFSEEHSSEGNYFWLFSGSNQAVGFDDDIPKKKFTTSNLGQQLIARGRSFKGYAEDLPAIGAEDRLARGYARKHVPWISFANVPNGKTVESSSNLRFSDFPKDFSTLPTVSFVIPNLFNDMHSGKWDALVKTGDRWLSDHLAEYRRWAKDHNSLLIVTFDENDNDSDFQRADRSALDRQRSQEQDRDGLFGCAGEGWPVSRRQRHHARQYLANDRSHVWVAAVGSAAGACGQRRYQRRFHHYRYFHAAVVPACRALLVPGIARRRRA
jgi:hypothetical protein